MVTEDQINEALNTLLQKCEDRPEKEVKSGTLILLIKLLYNLRTDMADLEDQMQKTLLDIKNTVKDESDKFKKRFDEKKAQYNQDYYS